MERISYLPHGAIENHFRPNRWNFQRGGARFTGQSHDVEVGLLQSGARYLNVHLGRWASPDPLVIHGAREGFNPYAYVGGRLLAATDPSGLQADPPAGPGWVEGSPSQAVEEDGTLKIPPTTYSPPAPGKEPESPPVLEPPTADDRKPFTPVTGRLDRWLLYGDDPVARFLQDDGGCQCGANELHHQMKYTITCVPA